MRLTMLGQPARWMSSPRCFLGRITLGRITSKGQTSGTLPAPDPSLGPLPGTLRSSVMSDNQLSSVLYRCREGLIAVGALSMAVNLLVLTVSVYMLQVYDRVLPGRSVETLIYLT